MFLFLSSAYFTKVKWSFSNKFIIFQGFRGGPTFSRGGGGLQLFPGGVQLLIPCRNPYNLWFSKGSGPPVPPPPLDPHLVHADHMIPWLRAQRRFALKLIGVFTESFGLFIRQLNYYVSRWTTPMVVTSSSTLQCIFEILLLMTYEELYRTFGL